MVNVSMPRAKEPPPATIKEEDMPKYVMTAEEEERIQKDFSYHPPKGDQQERYIEIRNVAKELAEVLLGDCPPSRERSLAMTNIEQAVMWANAAIARNEKEE